MSSYSHPLLGTIVVDPRAAQLLRDSGVQLSACLTSHLDGDLGDTAVSGTIERAALWAEGRVRSTYPIAARRLNIATDLDRGVTVVTASTRT
jgi:hypothetical protein